MADQQGRQLDKILGEYRLLRRLGGGTFGVVYLAKHLHTHALVAVKVLQAQLARREDFKDFINEARTIRLQHPHIVRVLDFGVSKEDLPYLVMEYASRGTLRDRYTRGTRLTLPTILAHAEQIMEALQYAHNQRTVHRDVKPENMLVRGDETLLLSDFGIAQVLESSSLVSHATFLGTPAYMAPEQSFGNPCFASDQYALAVVLYEWITGQRPFQGSALEVAMQHRLDQPPALASLVPELPLAVERVVLKALKKDPAERFATVQEFATALRTAIQTASLDVKPAQSTSPTLHEIRKTVPLVLEEHLQLGRMPSKKTDPTDSSPECNPLPLSTTAFPPAIKRRQLARQRLFLGLLACMIVSASVATFFTIHHRFQGPRMPDTTATNRVASFATATTAARPGRIWHSQNIHFSRGIQAVVWGDSQFVAVGIGAILTSPDGRTWTVQNVATPQTTLWGVAWSGSQFIAVGEAGTILASPDGRGWTARHASTSQDLDGVAWGNSQFVAVGLGGTILTSPDGRSWTTRHAGTSATLTRVIWADAQFIIVGGPILTSSDGRSWTMRNPGLQYLEGIAWSGSQFVTVGTNGTVLTSPDGRMWTVTWTDPSGSLTSYVLWGIDWSGSRFVAVGGIGFILTSP